MLRKEKRLTAREVRDILKRGRAVRGEGVAARYTEGTGGKAAVVVSTKVARTAVVRNSLRRAAYRALQDSLPPKAHVVFFIQTKEFKPQELVALCLKLS